MKASFAARPGAVGRQILELRRGATPACLSLPTFACAVLLSFGWAFQVWYDSLTAVCELPLSKYPLENYEQVRGEREWWTIVGKGKRGFRRECSRRVGDSKTSTVATVL